MKVYSPNEAAMLLEIKTATLRKYSLLLEKHGYDIERNSKRHRYYRDKDIMTLRNVITGSHSGATLEESVKNVVNLKGHSNESNVIDNALTPNTSDMYELKEMMIIQGNQIDKQSEYLIMQNELIENLINRIDQQDEYISNNLTAPTKPKEFEDPKIEDVQKPVKIKDNKRSLLDRIFNINDSK